ncbi:hypothetical protein [Chengkuizengella marina]|uniref:Uncharacterized protein n=1 Tax=Chengkuizengella marina TaxID=2507566 RepID=A0A6N9Q6Q7_9BACL|nr:hypothetical protein [Chengkuizengella marina]NBI30528.1 hypothetical protein [Chengkuizengella marina]
MRKRKSKRKMLSTGVLNVTEDTVNAHLELVNLNSKKSETVRFQVIDWVPSPPVVLFDQEVDLSPGETVEFDDTLNTVHYEIRIKHPGSKNVIVNTFAADADGFTVCGLTLTQDQLMKICAPLIEDTEC